MDERQRWNTRYAARGHLAATSPNPFLRDHLELLPRGRALELAMGDGHNAIYLARHGFSVSGIDISDVAVSHALQLAQRTGVQLEAQVRDLTAIALPAATYDVVVCFYYLQRDLFPQIIGALKPGGMVVYETYTQEQAQLGHPTNPAYLLQPNELLWAFKALRVRVYREVVISGPKAVASLIGERVV